MSQREIELILIRQLASYLATPFFIVDAAGNLVYYNEPAEKILGRRFEETGEMSAAEWATAWQPTDDQGKPLAPEDVPLVVALTERRPTQLRFWIRAFDGISRYIEVVAIPLIGQADRHLGAVAITWEVTQP